MGQKKFGFAVTDPEFRIAVTALMSAGAMETHRLNVFNEKYGSFDPHHQTDFDRRNVKRVVGHEGGHYQTGNKTTIANFFNVTLKEGITTLREQLFMEETGDAAFEKINRVRMLQGEMFAKDNSATSKPIYPKEAVDLDNLYNSLVYEKGAEVGRMLYTLMGDEVFCRALNTFITRYEGKAADIDQFIEVMSEVSGLDLTQFRDTWYEQEGVPHCDIDSTYDEESHTYTVNVKQKPAKDGQAPYHFPLSMALFDASGKEMSLELADDILADAKSDAESAPHDLSRGMLHVTKSEQTFVFKNIKERPTPSYFRNYSAPVTYDSRQSDEEALFLAKHETDTINRYMAVQRIQLGLLKRMMVGQASIESGDLAVFEQCIQLLDTDHGLFAELMTLPSVSIIAQQMEPQDYMAAHNARELLMKKLANEFGGRFYEYIGSVADETNYEDSNDISTYKSDAQSTARRACENVCRLYLSYSVEAQKDDQHNARLVFENADTMTERAQALASVLKQSARVKNGGFNQDKTLIDACNEFKNERIPFQKLLGLVGATAEDGVFELIKQITELPEYDRKIPNNPFSLMFAFSHNPFFHKADGSGYTLLADEIIKNDAISQAVAARLAEGFVNCNKLAPAQKELMQKEIRRILNNPGGCSDKLREQLEPHVRIP